jgi:UDP:flavonoid glycosyltransferase YjiC (YdhE family)
VAVEALLRDPGYRAAAARIGDEIRRMPAAERIAEALESRVTGA